MQSNEEVIILQHPKEIRLPVITLLPYQHHPQPMHLERLPEGEFNFDKEYRYQEVLQFKKEKLVSSYTISEFSEKKI